MELRHYRHEDLDQVKRFCNLALHEAAVYSIGVIPWDSRLGDIESDYCANGGEFWVGEIEGDLIAIGAFRQTPGGVAEIKHLFVTPESRDLGYEQLVLSKLEERAKELGYVLLTLTTSIEQKSALFYESAGYSMIDKREIDEEKRLMFGKMLVPPREITQEDEERFHADWNISQELTEYAKKLLRNEAEPDRTMEELLESELYSIWCRETRSFQVEFDRLEFYEDLLNSIESDNYIANIETKTVRHFETKGATASALKFDINEEVERVFAGMGINVTPSQLAMEMADFSREIGLGKPIRYIHFIALFSGATILDIEQDDLDHLVNKHELVLKLVEVFSRKYGDFKYGGHRDKWRRN